jgi:hypothetical protein
VWMKRDMTGAKHLQMAPQRNPFSDPSAPRA